MFNLIKLFHIPIWNNLAFFKLSLPKEMFKGSTSFQSLDYCQLLTWFGYMCTYKKTVLL